MACPQPVKELGLARLPYASYSRRAFGVGARTVSGAASICAPPFGSIGLGSVFGPPVGDRRLPRSTWPCRIPFGRLTPLPTPPPNAPGPACSSAPQFASAAMEADLQLRVAAQRARRTFDQLSQAHADHLLRPLPVKPFPPKVCMGFKLTYCVTSLPSKVPWAAITAIGTGLTVPFLPPRAALRSVKAHQVDS